jgi:hypothetical protein
MCAVVLGASVDAEQVRCTQHPHGGTRGARQCGQHAHQEGGERGRTHGRRAHCASHCCRMRQGTHIVERLYCKRPIQCLAPYKILTPHPLTARRVCTKVQ